MIRFLDWVLLILAVAIIVTFATIVGLLTVNARDLGQWEQTDPETRQWYQSLHRSRDGFPCCGEADAYWCDSVSVEGDKVFCTITDPRELPYRPHVPVGTKIEIPPEKYAFSHGNPTGHTIVFLATNGVVYCFVQSSGT